MKWLEIKKVGNGDIRVLVLFGNRGDFLSHRVVRVHYASGFDELAEVVNLEGGKLSDADKVHPVFGDYPQLYGLLEIETQPEAETEK